MTRRSLITACGLLCLLAILAVPAAATAAGTARIDPGLKDELWTIHVEHRLDRFDRTIEAGEETIAVLDDYGYPTNELSGIQDTISAKRDALSDALETRDRDALEDINHELLHLWKDYRQELRHLLRGS